MAVNLCRDVLRRRKREGYTGPWLPGPIETEDEPPSVEPASTEGRYGLLESVSVAFLLALEALSPKQRAVLAGSQGAWSPDVCPSELVRGDGVRRRRARPPAGWIESDKQQLDRKSVV